MEHEDVAARAVGLEADGADEVGARIVEGVALGFVPFAVGDGIGK
jgi:hypothetical protein